LLRPSFHKLAVPPRTTMNEEKAYGAGLVE